MSFGLLLCPHDSASLCPGCAPATIHHLRNQRDIRVIRPQAKATYPAQFGLAGEPGNERSRRAASAHEQYERPLTGVPPRSRRGQVIGSLGKNFLTGNS